MRYFRSLVEALRRLPANPRAYEIRLADAYQRVFNGNPTSEDQDIVLTDLAEFTGFYRVTHPSEGDAQLQFNEGMRFAFARIFRYLRMSDEERQSFETAAREAAAQRQALASNQPTE